ncbi:hypothetical protein GCM10029964_012720 [Kibdelosporangium lantanae]
MDELHQTGRDTVGELIPDGKARLDRIFEVAPGLAELAVGVVYGHLHGRPALDPRLREAAAISAIIASGGAGTPIRVHTRTGLSSGLAPAEITEVITEAAAFSGFPRAVMALEHVRDVFVEAGVAVPPPPSPREVLLPTVPGAEVVTTGPDTAIAVFPGEDGPSRVVWARVRDGEVVERKELS